MNGMQITGTYSFELNDLIGAYFAYRKTRPHYGLLKISAMITTIMAVLILLSFLPVYLITLVAGFGMHDTMLQWLGKFEVIFIVIMLLLLFSPVISLVEPLTRFRIKRDFEKHKSTYSSEYKLAVDRDGFHVDIPDWSSTMGWSRVEKVLEYRDGFLVVYNKGGDSIPIPRKAFKQETDLQEFAEWVSRATGKKIIRI